MNELKINKNGVNEKILATILSDGEMRKVGFTDNVKSIWYYSRNLKDISFNVSINKNDILDLRIDVLDEDFLQPYDFQHILKKNPTHEFALKIKNFVESQMEYLKNCGVLSGHIYGEYI